jgi:hypothetical protein
MPWAEPSGAAADVTTGKTGDIAIAGKLQMLRGVDLSARFYCYVFNISKWGQDVPKGGRSYYLWGVNQKVDRHKNVIQSPSIKVDGKPVQYEIGAIIPSLIIDTYMDQLGHRVPVTQNGEEVAADIICPSIAPTSDNGDLSKWGCGYFKRDAADKDPKPTENELRTVMVNFEDNMRSWMADGDKMWAEGQKQNINPVHIRACDYFGVKRPWNEKVEHPSECPGCGEPIKRTALRHTVASGGCGYIAPENRAKGFDMGLVTPQEAEMWNLIPANPKPGAVDLAPKADTKFKKIVKPEDKEVATE